MQAPEGHRAVTEGTVLVLEASRQPLGRVEEVFGQVMMGFQDAPSSLSVPSYI